MDQKINKKKIKKSEVKWGELKVNMITIWSKSQQLDELGHTLFIYGHMDLKIFKFSINTTKGNANKIWTNNELKWMKWSGVDCCYAIKWSEPKV